MNKFETYLLRDISHRFNIYDYFDRNNVWVFEHGDNMEDITVTFYEGDLQLENLTDLPKDIEFLVVKGNLTVRDSMVLRGFYQGEPGALIVTGNVHCKTMELEWGDIVIMGNLHVEQYIFSDDPEFEQGSLHVHGHAHVPYIFKGAENPSYYFDKKHTIIKDVVGKYESACLFYEKCDDAANTQTGTEFSANSYYQYLISKRN